MPKRSFFSTLSSSPSLENAHPWEENDQTLKLSYINAVRSPNTFLSVFRWLFTRRTSKTDL